MTFHARNGGVWEEIDDPTVRVGGTYRDIDEGYVRVGGVWEQFYQRAAFDISPTFLFAIAFDPATASVNINFQRDGDISATGGTPNAAAWIEPRSATIGDDYQIRATLNSGSTSDTGSFGVWQTLSSVRAWSWSQSGGGTKLANVTFELRRVSDSVVVHSQVVTVQCDVTGGG